MKTINHQYRTISPLQIVDIEDLSYLSDLFNEFLNLKSEEYYVAAYSDIIFTYKVVDIHNLETKILSPEKIKAEQSNKLLIESVTRFGGYNLPNTMDFTLWGNCHFLDDNNAIVYKHSSQLEYHIELSENSQEVEVMLDDKTLLSFKDTMLDQRSADLTSFSRKSKTHEYTFQEGELVLKKIIKKVQFLKRTRKSNYLSNTNKFITMDLETRTIDEVRTSYCVSIYDGKNFKSFYLKDYSGPNAEKDMLRDSILLNI